MVNKNKNNAPHNDKTSEIMSWAVVFFMMIVFWPIGLLLLFNKLNKFAKPEISKGKHKAGKNGNSSDQQNQQFNTDTHEDEFVTREILREAQLYALDAASDITQAVREARSAAYQVILELHSDLDREATKLEHSHQNDAKPDSYLAQDFVSELPQDITAQPDAAWTSVTPSRKVKAEIKKERTALEKKTGKIIFLMILLVSISHFLLGANAIAGAAWDIYSKGINRWADICLGVFHIIGGFISAYTRNIGVARYAEYKRYYMFVSGRNVIPITEISRAAGVSQRIAKRDIRAMINEGYLDRNAYIDNEHDCLVFLDAADEEISQIARVVEEELLPKADGAQENRHMAIIAELREIKNSIYDISVAKKIYRIEVATVKVFRTVDENPIKQPQIRRFVNYYLPTTLRLISVFAMLEKQGIRVENIFAARESIRNILDTLAAGFERQLDQMIESDAADISADVDALGLIAIAEDE